MKQILMLTSTWDSEYSKEVISGILERIGDDDTELHICNAYDNLIRCQEICSLAKEERYIHYLFRKSMTV